MATRKSVKSNSVSVDRLIDSSLSKLIPANAGWYARLSETGKSVADKTADRGSPASAVLIVLNEVMQEVCPEDVQYLPSESTIRKWLSRRRKTR